MNELGQLHSDILGLNVSLGNRLLNDDLLTAYEKFGKDCNIDNILDQPQVKLIYS